MADMEGLLQRLERAQQQYTTSFAGDGGRRQPLHVVYGGAHLFKPETPKKLGALALEALTKFAATPHELGEALGLPLHVAQRVHPRLIEKLRREPVEDLRIDFEDGYGHRPDAEEDEHACTSAAHYAKARVEGQLPAFSGLRIKPLSRELAPRALKTLSLFLAGCGAPKGEGVLVTLPKVVMAEQARVLVNALDELGATSARVELMIEAPQSLTILRELSGACGERLHAVHFGAYDYTAALDLAASEQRLRHPTCDFARHQMKVAFAGTSVFVSDGATTTFPVPIHRGATLNPTQEAENRTAVHAAWRASADDIRHSLSNGLYQGWDLHPAQLVARFGTVFGFFIENLEPMTKRLKGFVDSLGQATLSGVSFDDAATGQGLLNFFLRGLSCGALTPAELTATGLTADELASRSFALIARNRRP